jgi:ribonuclease HI
MKKVEIFSDGSSLGNPGSGGYCAILRYKGIEKIVSGSVPNTTNNRMELLAVIEAIKSLQEPCHIELYSDSTYVTKAISTWLINWIKKDFKNVKNADLWREFSSISKPHTIDPIWVRGHSGHIENERCDEIAKEEAKKIKRG